MFTSEGGTARRAVLERVCAVRDAEHINVRQGADNIQDSQSRSSYTQRFTALIGIAVFRFVAFHRS
jgi:hypothetical protein